MSKTQTDAEGGIDPEVAMQVVNLLDMAESGAEDVYVERQTVARDIRTARLMLRDELVTATDGEQP